MTVPVPAPLTDGEMMAASQPASTGPRPLTDAEMGAAPAPGLWESFGRGAVEGATFGFDDELGAQDREARERSRRANPWTHFMGEIAGGIVPMAAAAVLPTGAGQVAAAGRAAQLANRGAGLVRAALVPGEMSTARQALGQGVKLGTTYGALSGAGHVDTTDNTTGLSMIGERLAGAGTGAVLGGTLGAPLGIAGHAASRMLGAAINRLSPEMREVLEAARSPESQGVRDVMRQLGYDNYTADDLNALRAALRDPAQAHRYQDLNLIEALETRPATPRGTPGDIRPDVVTSPNIRDIAQDFANTGGRGRQEAVEAFATRRNEMPTRIQDDVERLFGAPPEGSAGDLARLVTSIDDAFGSASTAEALAAQAAQKAGLGRRYNALRNEPLVLSEDLGSSVHNLPTFQRALQYAAENDVIRNPGADFRALWSRNELGQTSLTLSPNNILDIHHALVLAAKPPIGGATPESVMAGNLKGWFSAWADKQLRGHKNLRTEYALFKSTLEAQDLASTLPLNRGGEKALAFFESAMGRRDAAGRQLQQAVNRYDDAVQRYESGRIKTRPAATTLNQRIAEVEAQSEIVEAFRRTWGERLKQELAQSGDANTIVRAALTPEGTNRIMRVLGPEQGRQFLHTVTVMEARNQGLALGLNTGGSDHAALRFLDRMVREGNTEAVEAFRQAWGQRIRTEISQATSPANVNAVVNKLLSQEGKNRILNILGEERGIEFIESLYNKKMQAGLSQSLFGNSDTAYKLARNKKTDALMDVLHGLQPWSFRPGQVWAGLRDIGSAAYKQRRADQGNQLLSQQGPEKVGEIIDAITARGQLATSGHPYIMKPGARALGPVTGTAVGDIIEKYAVPPPERRRKP